MPLRILCIGDVVGSPGRALMTKYLASLRLERKIDCVIVNAENGAAGSGLMPAQFKKLRESGADLVTMGDHIYRRSELIATLHESDRIVRPANFPRDAPGREFAVYSLPTGPDIVVISLLGRLFMKPPTDCPFRAADRVLGQLQGDKRIVVVDIHAEATSEKMALGWHLDGRVSLIYGTHTHVQTADERILPKGTGYITDVGMTGPFDSVLGRLKDRVISSMITNVPTPFDVAEGDPRISGIIAEIDPKSCKTLSIERVCLSERELAGLPSS